MLCRLQFIKTERIHTAGKFHFNHGNGETTIQGGGKVEALKTKQNKQANTGTWPNADNSRLGFTWSKCPEFKHRGFLYQKNTNATP